MSVLLSTVDSAGGIAAEGACFFPLLLALLAGAPRLRLVDLGDEEIPAVREVAEEGVLIPAGPPPPRGVPRARLPS